ncbi:hypothetical protein [Oscillatoria nigro-viridis]|uniref:hypothetical protein n=1 Tax=Phormidium nigroviride TaxID=482564 RepID=UPI00031DF1D0|nr:hypothetical protein [Oscillatoria nigro-viridis]
MRCRGLGFYRPDFKLWLWWDLVDRAFNTQVLMRSNYTFHRLLGLALQQVLLKLDRHTAYQQPGFCAVGLKTGFLLETRWFSASLAATVSQG